MPFEQVLVAVDGSQQSHRAVLAARELTALSKGSIVLLHVEEALGLPGEGGGPGECGLEQPGEAGRLIARESEAAREFGSPVRGEVVKGLASEIATVIVERAEAEQADLIVMGSRGLSALSALVVGSNAYKVLHLSSCPVLVVH